MSIELWNNIPEIKRQANKVKELEFEKHQIDEEVMGIIKEVEKLGINTKAFKQVIKSLLKKDDNFCSYVGALSTYTDVFYGETSL
jgi:uncharacterized protein (UPF0335 family)